MNDTPVAAPQVEDHLVGLELQVVELVERRERARVQHDQAEVDRIQPEIDALQREMGAAAEAIDSP